MPVRSGASFCRPPPPPEPRAPGAGCMSHEYWGGPWKLIRHSCFGEKVAHVCTCKIFGAHPNCWVLLL